MNKDKLTFWVVYPFIFLISKLPLWILYGVSNVLYYFIYYLIGYRKKVVKKNLLLCFPNKTDKERLAIEKKSYRHFVDIFIEMLKGFSISKKEIDKRYQYTNPEIFRELEALNKSVILLGAHQGNWEWLFNINSQTTLKCFGAYTEVENPYFDKYVKKNRGRFGATFVPTYETIPTMIANHRKGINGLYGLLSDQSPMLGKTHYWAPVFGHLVPIHTGAEMLASRFNFAVIYMHVEMPKRGYYKITFELMSESPEKTNKYPLTDAYWKRLEKDIDTNPEIYFWTHNRFKHMKKDGNTEKIYIKQK